MLVIVVIVVVMIIVIPINNNNESWHKRKCICFFINQKVSVQAKKKTLKTKRNFQSMVETFNRIKIENR